MHQKVKKCRACGAVVQSADIRCTSCHSNLKKRKTTYFGKIKKDITAFFDRVLNIRIKTK